LDINVLSAWDKYTGKGVIVAVNDDGMDLTHPDLASNLLTNLTYDAVRDTIGQGFEGAENSHGTVVGSIVGMPADNGVGGVGVAYEAKIVPGLTGSTATNASAFLANLAAGAAVSVNSWGADPAFAENFGSSGSQAEIAWGAALLHAATEARGGLGMVIEVSGGNERGNNADTAMSNFTGNKLIVAVGALTETGEPTSYSTKGASLLISAPGGVGGPDSSSDTGFGIASADIQSTGGYNTNAGVAGDYTYQNQGTSYSGPMVGGAAALMLQANPKLGFRDVSTILALSARLVDPTNTSWTSNAASDWNLGGMHFSRDFGYGLLDVSAAVRLAESWYLGAGTIANWQSAEGTSATLSETIADGDPNGLTVTAKVANSVRIERVEFDLNLSATNPSELSATITSPGGTIVTLFDQPLTRNLVDGAPDMSSPEPVWPGTFTVGSTAFLGEASAGTWTLKLTDKVTGVEATFNTLTVRAWGSAVTPNSQYVFTNEFAAANHTLADPGGVDTLNAAATANTVVLDLRAGNMSSVGSGKFTIAPGTVIENAIGGLGDDTLLGNGANNVLRGNGGNDSIDGGAGIDTEVYTGARANYTVTVTANGFTVSSADEGTDTLHNVERLQFSNASVALDIASPNSAGGIYRLYGAAFNRTPDLAGLGFYISEADKGASAASMAIGFTYSAEFQKAFGTTITDNYATGANITNLVTAFYTNVLQRAPDAAGRDWYADQITTQQKSVGQVLAEIADSPEYVAKLTGLLQSGIEFIPWGG
jgi:subtilisin-like proprotein convertase family protein